MTVDRPRRDELVEAIGLFLHEETGAYDFDDAIFEISSKTKDTTIHEVVTALWLTTYDDFIDHKIAVAKDHWNYIQRLRLILKSNASLEYSTRRLWTATQLIAAAAIAVFAWIGWHVGGDSRLLLIAIPFGPVSYALYRWRTRLYRNASSYDQTLYPFDSIAQVLWVGHDAQDFRNERYPAHLEIECARRTRRIFMLQLPHFVPWIFFSPILLLGQLLPVSIPVRRVVH